MFFIPFSTNARVLSCGTTALTDDTALPQTPPEVRPNTERTLPVRLRKPQKCGARDTDRRGAVTPGAADWDTARRSHTAHGRGAPPVAEEPSAQACCTYSVHFLT